MSGAGGSELQNLSVRAFAAMVDRDESTIREAIRKGRLAVTKQGLIPDARQAVSQFNNSVSIKRIATFVPISLNPSAVPGQRNGKAQQHDKAPDQPRHEFKAQTADPELHRRMMEARSDPESFLASGTAYDYERIKSGAMALAAIQELERKQGLYVNVSEWTQELERLLGNLRTRLISLGGALAARANPDNPALAQSVITEGISDCLSAIQMDALRDSVDSAAVQRNRRKGTS